MVSGKGVAPSFAKVDKKLNNRKVIKFNES